MSLHLASYRLRLPLSLSVTAILTALLMALALGWQTLENLRDDQAHNAQTLGHALAEVLVQALRNDDVWLAYALLRGPVDQDRGDNPGDVIWVLVDEGGRVFASNRPRQYRLDQPLPEALPWLSDPAPSVAEESPVATMIRDPEAVRRVLRLPLEGDARRMGTLIALLSDAPYLDRFQEILVGGALVVGGVLAVLLPLGWLWGRRLVAPLTQLADGMARVGKENLRAIQRAVPVGDSEIGRLGHRFAAMLGALADKEALEARMIQAERLAAVGRVAAGVAHEVNNPLAGMLMAIDTYRCRQVPDEGTRQLLDLLDRALQQIQGVVSALLVEARADPHPLTRQDLEDVRTLAQPKLARHGARLDWEGEIGSPVDLPAGPVRQLLLNLLLNAGEAAGAGGRVGVRVAIQGETLTMAVENTGRPLPAERLTTLFEPYAAGPVPPREEGPGSTPGRGQGFGLWVCYQIVSQLGGTISADAVDGLTQVRVCLPLRGVA